MEGSWNGEIVNSEPYLYHFGKDLNQYGMGRTLKKAAIQTTTLPLPLYPNNTGVHFVKSPQKSHIRWYWQECVLTSPNRQQCRLSRAQIQRSSYTKNEDLLPATDSE
ncbi:hypothetical protein O181_127655 [Austropuccinia psidii MF-1]|uniref:Uncharacterized protein n=1 Tax=Austropuccinia psidii MF-1 TaxID=1389203 RepID=A0A9Q3KTM2_9BASI|nr:hypothetical protein [Austropuccinia psidii MF-1]